MQTDTLYAFDHNLSDTIALSSETVANRYTVTRYKATSQRAKESAISPRSKTEQYEIMWEDARSAVARAEEARGG